jgi:hypothetical protein
VNEILKDASDIMKKIEAAEIPRRNNARALYDEHGYVAQTAKSLSDKTEEAEKNLAYFEQAEKNGLLKGDDLGKYKKLKEDLEAVKKTRDEARAKMRAIFNQPEVGDKIHEAALDDNEDFDIGIERKEFIDGLGAKVEEFLSEIAEIAEKQLKLAKKQTDAYDAFETALNKVLSMATNDSFDRFNDSPRRLLRRYFGGDIGLDDLEKQLENGVKKMKGMFRGKEKKAILGLTKSQEFTDAEEKKKQRENAIKEYNEYARTLNDSGDRFLELRRKWSEDIMKTYWDLRTRSQALTAPNTYDDKRVELQKKFKDDTKYAINTTVRAFCDARYSKDRTTENVYGRYEQKKGDKESSVNSLFSRISPFEGM